MTNLFEEGRILYISSIDVSIGNGPGVNEREFIVALYETIGDRAHFLIPQPREKIVDLPSEVCTFCHPHNRNPLNYWSHIASQVKQANKILSERDFDLVVIRVGVLPFSHLSILRRHPIPYAVKTLGLGPLTVLDEKGGLPGKALNQLNRSMFRKLVSNALVADSDSILHVEALQRLLGVDSNAVVWIDNAVNIKRFAPSSIPAARKELGLERFDPVIGYIGSRPWERGGMQLIQVAPRLLSKYPNLGVVIIGEGKEVEDMKKLAQELGVADRCRLDGYVPFDKVPLYINSLDVGVSISLREDRKVNSELKVRQYLACGKPVVLSPGGNEFVIQEKFGSVIQPTDIDALAVDLDRWLSLTSAERDAFSKRMVAYTRAHLSMEAAVAKRIEIWNSRLQAAPAHRIQQSRLVEG